MGGYMEVIPLNDIDSLAAYVMEWHKNMQDRLFQYAQVPTGMTVNVDGEDKLLVGDYLDGFVAAMRLAQAELENSPPFVTTTDD